MTPPVPLQTFQGFSLFLEDRVLRGSMGHGAHRYTPSGGPGPSSHDNSSLAVKGLRDEYKSYGKLRQRRFQKFKIDNYLVL